MECIVDKKVLLNIDSYCSCPRDPSELAAIFVVDMFAHLFSLLSKCFKKKTNPTFIEV